MGVAQDRQQAIKWIDEFHRKYKDGFKNIEHFKEIATKKCPKEMVNHRMKRPYAVFVTVLDKYCADLQRVVNYTKP